MSQSKNTAYLSNGNLILSLPNASKPTIWQMNIADVSRAAFEIDNPKNKKSTVLIMKDAQGQTEEIAAFEDKEKAMETLDIILKTLDSGTKSRKTKCTSGLSYNSGSYFKDFLRFFSFIILTLVFMYVLLLLLTKILNIFVPLPTAYEAPTASAPQQQSQPESGVPLSADDFLNQR